MYCFEVCGQVLLFQDINERLNLFYRAMTSNISQCIFQKHFIWEDASLIHGEKFLLPVSKVSKKVNRNQHKCELDLGSQNCRNKNLLKMNNLF